MPPPFFRAPRRESGSPAPESPAVPWSREQLIVMEGALYLPEHVDYVGPQERLGCECNSVLLGRGVCVWAPYDCQTSPRDAMY